MAHLFEDLATSFEDLQNQVESLEKRCADHSEQIARLESELAARKNEANSAASALAQAQRDKAQLQRAIGGPKMASLLKHGHTEPFLQRLANQRTTHAQTAAALQKATEKVKDEKAKAESSIQSLEKSNADIASALIDLGQQNHELRYLLKSLQDLQPETEESSPTTQFPATPFVLVLVDGDAFKWAPQLFEARNYGKYSTPGGLAAHNLKTAIVEYMMSHSEQIPIQSKIVARVLCNLAGLPHTFGRGHNDRLQSINFMEKFTEAMPLFDYYNAGRGKERVDIKIHEMIQLFLHNPYCKKLFLACSTDNGFARVLEQHVHDQGARNKICLISRGNTARELAALDLEEMEIPSIFAPYVHKYTKHHSASSNNQELPTKSAATQQTNSMLVTRVNAMVGQKDSVQLLKEGRACSLVNMSAAVRENVRKSDRSLHDIPHVENEID